MSAREVVVLLIIAVLILGAYVVLVKSPRQTAPAPLARQDIGAKPPPAAGEGEKENDYSPLWQTITRPPVPQPTQPAPAKPTAVFRLKGIVSQGAARMAIIEDPTGRQRLVGEGGAIDGARVTKISPREVTIEADGKTTTLQLEPKAEPEKPSSKTR